MDNFRQEVGICCQHGQGSFTRGVAVRTASQTRITDENDPPEVLVREADSLPLGGQDRTDRP